MMQLIEKNPEAAIVLFWKAINAGDRVDSALKDMAVVMKQLDRSEEAIEAIKSFRSRCSKQAQESLDNVLIDLYKGEVFNGKPTKTARSHGKKFQVSVKQEISRLLKSNYLTAEVIYRKAQMIDPDANKACNLGLCLIKQGRFDDAGSVLGDVLQGKIPGSEDDKAKNKARELLMEVKAFQPPLELSDVVGLDDEFFNGLELLMNAYAPVRSKRLPIFEEISFSDQLAC
ncbi:protein SULFUR DEFICIENCY-INDUCED 1 isoform X3 [Gossypium australe]|uniref:Protein SULFUR DEFICIENCY-INDUCED 1 isoform X3 n=1 Tax=Gossypium australe TaxID=47621 RepID=A0A5B6W198_9ROSI|nr:protein SULFUR DEFICIENCY-INDUCED 1 isoform X3 [Gossypium australe]